jgi:hypothetical protein
MPGAKAYETHTLIWGTIAAFIRRAGKVNPGEPQFQWRELLKHAHTPHTPFQPKQKGPDRSGPLSFARRQAQFLSAVAFGFLGLGRALGLAGRGGTATSSSFASLPSPTTATVTEPPLTSSPNST